VRNGPSFMEIIVDRINAQRAEVYPAGNGIHIGPIHVNKPSCCVDLFGDFPEAGFKKTAGVGIGHHNSGKPVTMFCQLLFEIGKVDQAIRPCFEQHDSRLASINLFGWIPSHYCRGKVCSVSTGGDEEDIPVRLSAIPMVGLEKFEPDQFSLRTGHRLRRDTGQSGNSLKPFLNLVEQFKAPLSIFGRRLGM